jgi:hypothetical protein
VHVVPHAPQLVESVCVFVQMPPHAVVPPAHAAHDPPTHTCPRAQALPHMPQFAASLAVFTHSPLHGVVPVGHVVHDPLAQT